MLETSQLTKTQLLQGVEGAVFSRKVARNTVLYRLADGTECIKYHDTVVVRKSPNGVITLDSGGWQTVTTKARFSEYGGIWIDQRNGVWYMPGGSAYYDGIQIKIAPRDPANPYVRPKVTIVSGIRKSRDAEVKKMKARIRKFCLRITPEKIAYPSSGDCWMCCMTGHKSDAPAGAKDRVLGDLTGDHSHLIGHIKEGYIHGSLLVNAMHEKGFQDNQIGYYFEGAKKRSDRSFELSMIRRAVSQYLQRRLIPGINVR